MTGGQTIGGAAPERRTDHRRESDPEADGGTAAPSPDGGPAGRWRVAIVLGLSTESVGRHVSSLVRGLTGRGMRVDVYCPAATADQFGLGDAGATVTAVDIPASPGPWDVGIVSQLRRALRAGPVDVIHAHGLRAGFVAAIARGRTPLVVTWHQTFVSRPLAWLTERGVAHTVAGAADLSLCVSKELVTTATRLGARDARLCPMPAPVLVPPRQDRVQVREEFGLGPHIPVVLSAGRLHPQERHDVLVSAAARWRLLRPTPSVIIEGTGPAYRDLAAQIIIGRAQVVLAGHRRDLADLMGAADLAVVTSDGESRQDFARQALASGVPLVVADEGGLSEIVGDPAALVPVGDVDALDAAVRSLLEHPDRLAGSAAAGLARARSWPTEAAMLELVSAAYADVTSRADTLRK